VPRVAVVGYTNAGKSSLVNALTGADCVVEDGLFSTLDPRVRRLDLGRRSHALLIDTVGFLRKLPHDLIASFRSTLEEAAGADLLVHVVDASHPALEEHLRVTRETIAELGGAGQPELLVFNKIDRLSSEGMPGRLRALYPGALMISAALGWGLQELRATLRERLTVERPPRRVTLPAARQDLVHQVYVQVQVTRQSYRRDRVVLEYRASEEQEGRLRRSLQLRAGARAPEHRAGAEA
jgi:GTP-binding protein HflX